MLSLVSIHLSLSTIRMVDGIDDVPSRASRRMEDGIDRSGPCLNQPCRSWRITAGWWMAPRVRSAAGWPERSGGGRLPRIGATTTPIGRRPANNRPAASTAGTAACAVHSLHLQRDRTTWQPAGCLFFRSRAWQWQQLGCWSSLPSCSCVL